ncbi:hypothetical protein M8J76_000383 [Diaphorina citri]|nr:hypothetical protein M8J76_000383 [Diaphorina citri]
MDLIGLLLLTTLLLCLISIYRWATGSLDYWQKRGIPYVPALPAVGNFWSVLSGRICQAHLYRDLYHSFPASVRYFGILIGTCPTLIIKDPALVVKVLIKDFSHFYDRGFHVGPNDYLGNNLFFMQNPQWKAARTKMVTVFSTAKMKATFEIVDKCSNDFIDYLHSTIPDSKDVPTKVFMGDIFTDLVCKTICGINIHSITSPNKEHVYFMNVCFAPGLFQFIRSLLSFFFPKLAVHFTLFPQEVADYFTKLTTTSIEMRKQEKAQAEKRVDYLQLMIELYEKDLMLPESERVIRMQEVVSGVFVLILAGHETSSSTSTNVLHELAYNQEVQDKARREVQKVYKEGGGKVTYEDLAKMTYLEQVISEALRLGTSPVSASELPVPRVHARLRHPRLAARDSEGRTGTHPDVRATNGCGTVVGPAGIQSRPVCTREREQNCSRLVCSVWRRSKDLHWQTVRVSTNETGSKQGAPELSRHSLFQIRETLSHQDTNLTGCPRGRPLA